MSRLCVFACLAILAGALSSCVTAQKAEKQAVCPEMQELQQQSYLYEVMRHLYRWYLDEAEVESLIGNEKFTFCVRTIETSLDPGDNSVLGEILLPQLDIIVKVKKADYTIDEIGVVVKSPGFKIIQIDRGRISAASRLSCQRVEVDMQQMRDYLFRTRNQQDFPDNVMIERLRQALRKEVAKEGISITDLPAGDRIVHLAPLSPIANETWVFWEDGRKLFYFSSDIDLANPAVWEHETMMVRVFDVDRQVVVSPQEVPSSNRFLTRYQVSRALFNCVVLGRRIAVPPPSDGQ